MPAELKRKVVEDAQPGEGTSPKRRAQENSTVADNAEDVPTSEAPLDEAAQKAKERVDRFKALQARQTKSRDLNRKETAAEAHRVTVDPNLLSSISRKHAMASHKLLKADTEAAGEDFERKRAWDWTIEEAEKWDKRMAKKDKHRDDVAFQDYRNDAKKVYKRQLREFKPDMEAYESEKQRAIERAAQNGSLEIVETETGELIAVDKDGVFYSTADSTDFTSNKPDKAAIDRLVGDIKKADEVRMKKRKERSGKEDDGDVTYINQKNKVSDLCVCHDFPARTDHVSAIQHEACPTLRCIYQGDPGQLRAWYSYVNVPRRSIYRTVSLRL
jgi:pre-mRNA-splicing factor SYF2